MILYITLIIIILILIYYLIKKNVISNNINNNFSNNLDIYVVGAGGNGQTSFMNTLNNYNVNTNSTSDIDKIKHLPKYTNILNNYKFDKIIYLYNDCFNSVCSHFRRNWAQVQINKLGNIHDINLKEMNINNINDYLALVEKTNTDYFGYYEQFQNWKNSNYNIYYLNFSKPIWNELNKFIGKKINYEFKNNNKYDYLKNKYKKAYKLYKNIYNKINIESQNMNKKLF